MRLYLVRRRTSGETTVVDAEFQSFSFDPITVNGTAVQTEDATVIKFGSEIIPGPDKDICRTTDYHGAFVPGSVNEIYHYTCVCVYI